MSDVAAKVKAIIVDKLGVDEAEVTTEASFTNDLGADSLDTVELIMEFEKEFNISIPDEQAEKIGFIEGTISRTFELWGFRKIIPPMLEFEELLALGMDESLREKSFRFEDRQSHRLLAIPPDITPQIARIESMRMKGYLLQAP